MAALSVAITSRGKNELQPPTDTFLIMARKPTSLIPRTHRELCEIAERWLPAPVPLSAIGMTRPPQSWQYITAEQAAILERSLA